MVHAYKNNGYDIVLDVNSGSVHVVDDIVFDLIHPVEEQLIKRFKSADITAEGANAVSDESLLPELVNEGENGFICQAFSPESICSCLEKIQNLNEADYKKMCVSAMNKAKAECDSDKYYERLMSCYTELISKAKAE